MKRLFAILAVLALLMWMSCSPEADLTVAVSRVRVTPEAVTLFKGQVNRLVAEVLPADATDKTVSWSSSDTEVAIVDDNGAVTGLQIGTASVTAAAGGKTGSCIITVIRNSDEAIHFADKKVKEILVANFDGNGDGEISYREAESVKSIGKLFPRNDDITTFEEFKFFTGVTELEEEAFFHCMYFTSITLPDSIEKIGDSAFRSDTSLVSVSLPQSVKTLGKKAFQNCWHIQSISLPNSITAIDEYTFHYCKKLQHIDMPARLEAIGFRAFWNCASLTNIDIPESVTSINGAFAWCPSLERITGKLASNDGRCLIVGNELVAFAPAGLTEYAIPAGIDRIGNYCFDGCTLLKSIDIPEGVTTIGSGAFGYCEALESVSLPEGVTSLGDEAFYACKKLSHIHLPESLVRIERYDYCGCFTGCDSLEDIVIPAHVETIGEGAFRSCLNLKAVYLMPLTPPVAGQELLYRTDDCVIYVHKQSLNAYKSAENWSNYSDRIKPLPSEDDGDDQEDNMEHMAVDLGLSVKWASCNVGATKPEEYGDCFAWGETEPKEENPSGDLEWSSYKWYNNESDKLTKYCLHSDYGYNGFTDNFVTLLPEDDAAHTRLGGKWRMPTLREWGELTEFCSLVYWIQNDIEGVLAVSTLNGNSIFFPASPNPLYEETYAHYWTSSLFQNNSWSAWSWEFGYGTMGSWGGFSRCVPAPVRPVTE